jgi:Ubiquitin carboxyl-terminal hydrolase
LAMLDDDYKLKPEAQPSVPSAASGSESKQEPLKEGEDMAAQWIEETDQEEVGSHIEHCAIQRGTARSPNPIGSEEPYTTQQLSPLGAASQLNSVQSFSELQPDEIEELLYARLPVHNCTSGVASSTASPPRCKLAGGRMTSPDPRDTVMLHKDEEPVASVANGGAQPPAQSTIGCSTPSPVESYFNTEVRVRLTCDSCKFTRSHLENFLHLSLEIGEDSNSVADGIRKFFSPEKREVKCEKCFCETAQQTMEITRLPRALLLHFKRFIVHISDDYTSINYRKNQGDFPFEDKLEFAHDAGGVLSDCVCEDVVVNQQNCDDYHGTYNIRSVVNHIGSSASCGHYTADALRLYPGQPDREWTRFNDSFVSKINAADAINNSSRTAYLVVYELS